MMTRCNLIESLLTEYLSGELGPLQRSIVDEHLAECAACRAELADAREMGDAVASLPHVACPDRVTRAIESVVAAEPSRPRRRTVRRWATGWRTLGAGGVVAAAVLLAVVLPRNIPHPTESPRPDPAIHAGADLDRARAEFAWTIAYTAAVIDRTEKRTMVHVLRRLRTMAQDVDAEPPTGGQG